MAAPKRIYVVSEDDNDGINYLVRASTPSQAINHIVKAAFIARVASQNDLVDLVATGHIVEEAGDDQNVVSDPR